MIFTIHKPMTSLWLPNYTQFTKIGDYKGYTVTLSDLSPLVEKIEYFPIKNSKNKVKMPVADGVKMLYDLFMKDIWGLTFFKKYTQLDAFGYFAVKLVPRFLGSDEKLSWNGYFWTQQVLRLLAEGKLTC